MSIAELQQKKKDGKKDWKQRRGRVFDERYRDVSVPGDGPTDASIMFIGEKVGMDEPKAGRPFAGAAGFELNRYLQTAGLRREEVYITNVIKTYSEYDPSDKDVELFLPWLISELQEILPSIICPLGRLASRLFLGDVDVEVVHGLPHLWNPGRAQISGDTFGGWKPYIFPMYNPAAGLHNADLQPVAFDDFRQLRRFLNAEIGQPCDEYPSPDYCASTAVPHDRELAIDTEGSARRPWCATWATRPGMGRIVRPATEEYARFKQAVESSPLVWLHNSLHDLDVLRATGIELGDDQFIDTMVLAYLLQLEPQGLKALAYRLAGMEMHSYEELIAPARQRLSVEYLRMAACLDWPDPEPYCIIEKGKPKVKKPWNIGRMMKRILSDVDSGKVNKDGKRVDAHERWNKIEPFRRDCVEVAVGEMPTATLDDVPEKDAEFYACRDADATIRIAPQLMKKVKDMQLERVMKIDHSVLPMIDRMQYIGMRVNTPHMLNLADRMTVEMDRLSYQIYKETGARINPDSGDQVAELLFGQLGLQPLRYTDGGKRGSTDDETLQTLLARNPQHTVLRLISDYRERSKIRNTYARKLPLHADHQGRVHPNLRVTRVVSGRLAAHDPNLLGIPIRSELGQQVRAGFVPGEGHVFGAGDLSQIEMRETAHLSQDKELMGVYHRGEDVHAVTTKKIFGVPDCDLKLPRYRVPAKNVGFGVLFGLTPQGLLDLLNKEGSTRNGKRPTEEGADFWTVDDCENLIKAWFDAYPMVKVAISEARQEARRYGYVRDMYGRIRYLPGVHSVIERVREEALRQAFNHKIQSNAQCHMKMSMAAVWGNIKRYWSYGWWVEPVLQVHDELLLEMQDDPMVREIVEADTWEALTRTVKLSVPIGASWNWGYTWAELK